MKIKSLKFFYYFKLALKSLFRNSVMSITSILVLMSCIVIIGSFWSVAENFTLNLNKIDGYNKIVVFLDYNADDFTVKDVEEKIWSLNNVEDVIFVSREEALEGEIAKYGDFKHIFEMYKDDNPLKHSFEIVYKNTDDVATLVYQLEQIDDIVKINNRLDIAQQIDNIKNVVSVVGYWLMILLFLVALFVIINTIKLSVYARREQISVMRYVGAGGFFVAFPFIIEGTIIGTLSAILAYGVQFLIYKYLVMDLVGGNSVIDIIPFSEISVTLAVAFIVIGILTGLLASIISLRKYNREKAAR